MCKVDIFKNQFPFQISITKRQTVNAVHEQSSLFGESYGIHEYEYMPWKNVRAFNARSRYYMKQPL